MAIKIISKRCPKCKEDKPLSEFHKHRSKRDSYQVWCIKCCKNYNQNPKRKLYNKEYAKTYYHSKAGNITCKRAAVKYRQSEKGKAAQKRYKTKYPDRIVATAVINHAVEQGKLLPAHNFQCGYCSKQAKHYHHHKGYQIKHQSDVIPVCADCHKNHLLLGK